MNVIEDPIPFSSDTNDTFATFCDLEEDSMSFEVAKDIQCIKAKVHFIPNISIPTIPDKQLILSKNNFMEWTNNIPSNIKLKDRFYFLCNDSKQPIYGNISQPEQFKKILWENDTILHIEIYVSYKLQLSTHKSIAECLTISQSIGESEAFTNILLLQHYPRINTARTLRERNRARRELIHPESILQQIQQQTPQISDNFNILINTLLGNTVNLQQDYNEENNNLVSMGFTNRALNRSILRRTMGSVDAAVEFLISQDG